MNIKTIDPVTSWAPCERAYDAGDREWFPTTEDYADEMLGTVPPWEISRSETHGYSFAVGEPWKHTASGEPILLFFRSLPQPACRIATPLEMHREIFPQPEPRNIHWQSVTERMDVRDTGASWTANGKLVYWHTGEALDAMYKLKALAREKAVAA